MASLCHCWEQSNLLCLHRSPSCHQHSLSYEEYFHMDPLSPETRWQLIVLRIFMSFSYSAGNEDKLSLCFVESREHIYIFFFPWFICIYPHFLCFSTHRQLDCMFSVYFSRCCCHLWFSIYFYFRCLPRILWYYAKIKVKWCCINISFCFMLQFHENRNLPFYFEMVCYFDLIK